MVIFISLQTLFEGATEDHFIPGLGIVPGRLTKSDNSKKSVHHIGWNSATVTEVYNNNLKIFYGSGNGSKNYYVYAYAALYKKNVLELNCWTVATARYGNETFVGAIGRGNVLTTQFHKTKQLWPSEEDHCWYQCTSNGGQEGQDLDVQQLGLAVEALRAGEILLNCIDKDGSNRGFDLKLIEDVKKAVKIPVIAFSDAGVPNHFRDVFRYTMTDTALGAGMIRTLDSRHGNLPIYIAVPLW